MPEAVIAAARQFLRSFAKPCRILAAVSGGSDSKGLLLALHSAIRNGGSEGFSLAACTIDHALRPESADEAAAVAAFCAELGIPHLVSRWEGDKPRSGIQAAARQKRYELLADAAAALGADCIATGHTRDDQRETIAMRTARGEGEGQGSAGMASTMLYGRRIWVSRPFLGLSRADIRAFLSLRGIEWFDDPSNANPLFERVRVRSELEGSEEAPAAPWSAAQRAASSTRAAAMIETHVRVHETVVAEIAAAQAGNMSDADWRRALLSVAAVLGGRNHLPGHATIERISGFLQPGAPGRMTAGGVVYDRRPNGLYLYREARNLSVLVIDPGETSVWDGRFNVTNDGQDPVVVTTSQKDGQWNQILIDGDLPRGVAKRATRAAPHIGPARADMAGSIRAKVECRIALYDTFLPGFDRTMADAVAMLFGRERYPAPPVHDVFDRNGEGAGGLPWQGDARTLC
ncbi:tRNA lysidine(34) synthetase TilS [Sinorhizobium mexicanum]|uniref:tRNA(Ile)-lysidine synthase n=1 Tax=Sinorhizobium mexicanum TaxID=375549 RepID=A0A859R0E2_9HYPH|nr:tRNA lysidine(34) synthetase TilS [Sinorhizobium mexicanum]MBP1885270.1 tRNA(Ile)-lysidine synthase [Sinorhizobium mexicanum]QLL63098.1 tRNA lysidine(34) synthetase TilS [Sinorhizobium mexicanum]